MHSVIHEYPQSQCVLEGNTATFHCNATGKKAYWWVNDDLISNSPNNRKNEFEAQGFMFNSTINESLRQYNLTLTVLTSEQTNNSVISCCIEGHCARGNHSSDTTYNEAYLQVICKCKLDTHAI